MGCVHDICGRGRFHDLWGASMIVASMLAGGAVRQEDLSHRRSLPTLALGVHVVCSPNGLVLTPPAIIPPPFFSRTSPLCCLDPALFFFPFDVRLWWRWWRTPERALASGRGAAACRNLPGPTSTLRTAYWHCSPPAEEKGPRCGNGIGKGIICMKRVV